MSSRVILSVHWRSGRHLLDGLGAQTNGTSTALLGLLRTMASPMRWGQMMRDLDEKVQIRVSV